MLLLRLAAAGALAAMAHAQAGIAVPLVDQHPELGNLSSWVQRVEHRGGAVDKARRGVFPVGNGSVFGYFGLAERAGTVQALTGPSYATDRPWAPQGHFGEQSFALHADGRELALPLQTVARVRGANFVVTEDRSEDGVALTTLNFAPPGGKELFRIVQVHNGGKQPLRGVELIATVQGVSGSGDDHLRVDCAAPPYTARFQFVADGFVADGRLVRPFGELAAGQTVRTEFTMTSYPRGDTLVWPILPAGQVEKGVGPNLAWWRQRLANTATLATDPPQVGDLFEDWKVLLLAQRCATTGLFVPMVNDRVCRVRELAGPLLLCLRYNLWDDAKVLLQAIHRTASRLGAVPEELSLDVVPGDAPAPDWSKVTVPAGGLGSLVILYHEWYWRASGDLSLVRAHLPMLQRCLDGQGFTKQGLQPFSGNEEHRALLLRLGDAAGLGAIAEAGDKAALSLDANVAFLVANLAMGEFHHALHRAANPAGPAPPENTSRIDPIYLQRMIEIAQLNERHFWPAEAKRFAPALARSDLAPHPTPLANSNLRLQWLGWTFASAEKNRRNLVGSLQELWRAVDAVRVGLLPATGFTTGETQGLLLYALTDLDDRAREGALAELLRMAGPAGEWGQLHDDAGLPTWTRDAAWPERCQPNSSGINLDAICFSLTGMRYAAVPSWDDERQARFRPRLPPGARSMDFRDLRRDGRHLHLHAEERVAKLSAAELEDQEARLKAGMLDQKDRKDPEQAHRRFVYRVEMVNPPPDAAHIVCAVNLGKNTMVRYLAERFPSFGDTVDPPVEMQAHYPTVEPSRSR